MSQSEQIKILWGRATWELFHTIAAKINEDLPFLILSTLST